MMNILIVSHGIPSDKDPQWGCFEMDQAVALNHLGHRVSIVAIDGRFRKYLRKIGIKKVQWSAGIVSYKVFWFPLAIFRSRLIIDSIREIMMMKLVNRVVKEQGLPDVIYAHYLFSMRSLKKVKEKYHIPIVGIEHWSVLNQDVISSDLYKSGCVAYSIPEKILAVSPSLKIQIQKYFQRESEVVPDMVDDLFLKEPISDTKPISPFTVVAVGSLIKRKGIDVLLQAISDIDDMNVSVCVVGAGEECDSLHKLASDLNIVNRVRFVGMKSRSEIVQILKNSNIFCLPSRSETFGVAVIEAMAMGVPVVTTRCGGPEYFMNEKCGRVVNVDDVEGLKNALEDVIQHYDEFSPQEIRDYVRSQFSGEMVAKKIESIMEDVVNKKINV